MSESKKQETAAMISILISSINELYGEARIPHLSQDEIDTATIEELLSRKRDLRDLARTLGGIRK